jgi:hypothetical protein
MVVDVARNARRTIMYFFALPEPILAGQLIHAQPEQAEVLRASLGLFAATRRATKVRWYNAPKGAKRLPFPTAFALSDFLSKWERVEVQYGEDPFYRWQWDNGSPPQGATGQHYCGTPQDFDVPKKWSPDLPTLVRGPTGLPCCCAPVVCGSLVLVAEEIAIATPLGLTAQLAGTFCGGEDPPLYQTVRLSSADYPDLDGLIFHVPIAFSNNALNTWQGFYRILGRDAEVVLTWVPDFGLGDQLLLEFDWSDTADPDGPYILWDITTETDFTCNPFAFSITAETLQEPGDVPTGKFITLESWNH